MLIYRKKFQLKRHFIVLFRFRYNACVRIPDLKGYIALHHAVLGNHEQVVDVFLQHFPAAFEVNDVINFICINLFLVKCESSYSLH